MVQNRKFFNSPKFKIELDFGQHPVIFKFDFQIDFHEEMVQVNNLKTKRSLIIESM